MLRRITLDNYMAHSHTAIDLADGLTVLVGPNNCGKSAVVEALRTLCFNEGGDYMVRHGAHLSQVSVETDDGHTLVWRRKDNTVSYVVDGQEVHRLGRGGVPDNLHTFLRLAEVVTGSGNTFDVHFGMQKDPIFLLSRKVERQAADFFSASSDAEKLMEMQKLHKKKVRDAQLRRKSGAEELARADSQLASLAQLDQIAPAVEEAERRHAALGHAELKLEDLAESIQVLERTESLSTMQSARCVVLGGLATPPAQVDEAAAALVVQRLTRALDDLHREGSRCAALSGILPPPALADVTVIESFIRDLAQVQRRSQTCRNGVDVLGALADPPVPQSAAAIEQLIAASEANRKAATGYAADIVEIGAQLAEAQQRIRDWAQANPTCPLCGAPMEADRLLEGGHAHV